MRRATALILIFFLLAQLPALATGKFSDDLFDTAKQALSLMSYGEYKKAVKKLNFSANAPTAGELSDFVETSLSDMGYVSVQTDVAVAYRIKGVWRLAIPIEEPSYDTVQTFILRSKDGKRFDGYKSLDWYEVQAEIDEADAVVWNGEYEPGDLFIIADN